MKYLKSAAILAALSIIIVACGSSETSAQADFYTKSEMDQKLRALQDQVTLLSGELAALQASQGPRAKAGVQTKASGTIGRYAPLGYTGADCTGDIVPIFLGAIGLKQGFVFTETTGGPYLMIPPNPDTAERTVVSRRLTVDGTCEATSMTFTYPIAVANDVEVCGVPDGGIPETVWPEGAPPNATAHNADYVEVWTPESCLTLIPASAMPPITVGSE